MAGILPKLVNLDVAPGNDAMCGNIPAPLVNKVKNVYINADGSGVTRTNVKTRFNA